MNLMLLGVATRKIGRAVRLPDGPLPRVDGDGTSKSAASRRFVALSQQRLEGGLGSDNFPARLLVIQIGWAARGRGHRAHRRHWHRWEGDKHILGIVEGANRECRCSPGSARQPRRARARSEGAAPIHSRWSESPLEGGPRNIRAVKRRSALPGAQGAQHRGALPEEAPLPAFAGRW